MEKTTFNSWILWIFMFFFVDFSILKIFASGNLMFPTLPAITPRISSNLGPIQSKVME